MLAKGTKIKLTLEDQAMVETIARDRYASNRKSGVRNAKIGPQSNYETDLAGIGGEIAFCRLVDALPDLTIHPRSMITDTGDTMIDDMPVDVKTTMYSNGKLLARITLGGKTDTLFVLMTGVFPRYTFAGCLPGTELLTDKRIVNLGYGPTYGAKQEDLRDLT